MANNTGTAIWRGGLKGGDGSVSTQSNALHNSQYTYKTRFEDDRNGTNPEELIGAAHAACFSQFLAALLEKEEKTPNEIKTDSVVTLSKNDSGPFISKIELRTTANVPDIEDAMFQELAQKAKENCPVSKVLKAVPEMTLQATLANAKQ
ncbi:MAG: OsmC family peroxiredoxin [Hymenobacteraceae bacterium]|nr:OsmC family peroxiredoxin [Hymenobacteraceae bacterium]MDX5394604.1 OsmC family peroxiredoxin [Hymenobacteraceae bacterium]MDX5510632.1 OsmC family peroxiredoxin [Hymenobacteraceae bacterium]